MSKAKYKKDFWYNEVKGKLENVRNDLEKGARRENFNKDLQVIYNEFKKEKTLTPDIKFDYVESLTPDKISPDIVSSAFSYIDLIRKYYIAYSNNAKDRRESLLTRLQSEDSEGFLRLRDMYTNESLEEFVTNKNETDKIIEFKVEIMQKLDPIYMDPKHNFVKAHFYSPEKKVFGNNMDTFTINVLVLWFMNIALYFALYFRLLKKVLDSGDVVMGKKLKGSE